MIEKFKIKKITYIFNTIALIVLVGTIMIYTLFENTSEFIQHTNRKANIGYIDNITTNIANQIKKVTKSNIYKTLECNSSLREKLEDSLSLFVTKRYRYIYVLDRPNNNENIYRFLLDGATNIEDKSEFGEEYTPLNIKKWNKVYKDKKAIFFKHTDIESLWLTYIKPIIINDKVEAVIVIDFSLQDHKDIIKSLNMLDQSFEFAVAFAIFIFFMIIVFSYIDNQRIKELEDKTIQIQKFNLTLQDKIEKEIQKSREKDKQLLQQSRLAQMGEMISMIAHQWRQPLASISSTSAGLVIKAKLNKLDNEKILELAAKISGYTQHLSSTIDDFREFFKVNKEKKEADYTSLIDSVLNIVEVSISNKDIKIIKDLNSDEVLYTYPNELKQVVLNLIKNAEDILLEKNIKNPYIKITTNGTKLTVSDNAGGVPPNIIDKVFDPYFSTKTEKNGTGLGLYMSKTIIEDHCNGTLSVHNDEFGAVFTIEL